MQFPVKKVKQSLQQALEVHRIVRRRGSHIFWTVNSQMAVRLSALRAGRPLPPGRFLVFISVRSWVGPRAIVQLEGLGQLKNPMTSSGSWNSVLQNLRVRHHPMRSHFAYILNQCNQIHLTDQFFNDSTKFIWISAFKYCSTDIIHLNSLKRKSMEMYWWGMSQIICGTYNYV
jgi:hypothetical protein